MRHCRLGTVLVAVAASAPAVALANAGIGLLSPSIFVTVPALIPAIAVEAVVLGRMLGVGIGRALWLSFLANLTSTVLGGAVAVALDMFLMGGGPEPGRGVFLTSLVPMFFVSWWLERRVVRAMLPPDRMPRATRATLVANAVSYALMAIAVFLLVPVSMGGLTRSKVSAGIMALQAARTEIHENFTTQGVFPAPRSIAAGVPELRSLNLERDGRLVAVFSIPESPDADGRRVVLEPRVEGKRIVEWVCFAPDMPRKYLPTHCRQPPPGK